MDELLARLKSQKYGCYIGNNFVGAICYADDLALIAPSKNALLHMINVCEQFSNEYYVKFNCNKSVIITYNTDCNTSDIYLNGSKIDVVDSNLHLGHYVGKGNNSNNITKGICDVTSRTNHLMAKFGYCSSDIRSHLFNSYCSSFYGSSLWSLNSAEANRFYTTWRKCIRRIWNVPYRTHNILVPCIQNVPSIEKQLLYRFSSFYYSVINSSNKIVKPCGLLSAAGDSIVARNQWYLLYVLNNDGSVFQTKSIHAFKNILKSKLYSSNFSCHYGVGNLIRELCLVRDSVLRSHFDDQSIRTSIEVLCTH